MSKRTVSYLLLACLAGGVVFTIGLHATKPPSLRVGTTIRNPKNYLTQQLRAHRFLQEGNLTAQPGGVYTSNTRFVILGHAVTERTSVYCFDTNGTVLSIYTQRRWPILHL